MTQRGRSRLLPIIVLVVLWPVPSHAVFRCVDEHGNISFRDTPCPVVIDRPTRQPPPPVRPPSTPLLDNAEQRPRDWLSIAQIANQIRLNSDIAYVEHLLGVPVQQQRAGIRAHYAFELPALRGMTYRAEIHTVNNRVTAIYDTFRRDRAAGMVTPGMLYDEVLMTWGDADEERLRRTAQGIETTLIYISDERNHRGIQVTMRDDVVVSIQYDVAVQR